MYFKRPKKSDYSSKRTPWVHGNIKTSLPFNAQSNFLHTLLIYRLCTDTLLIKIRINIHVWILSEPQKSLFTSRNPIKIIFLILSGQSKLVECLKKLPGVKFSIETLFFFEDINGILEKKIYIKVHFIYSKVYLYIFLNFFEYQKFNLKP